MKEAGLGGRALASHWPWRLFPMGVWLQQEAEAVCKQVRAQLLMKHFGFH